MSARHPSQFSPAGQPSPKDDQPTKHRKAHRAKEAAPELDDFCVGQMVCGEFRDTSSGATVQLLVHITDVYACKYLAGFDDNGIVIHGRVEDTNHKNFVYLIGHTVRVSLTRSNWFSYTRAVKRVPLNNWTGGVKR